MEQEMKISAALVRRLRTERGWSQDQLAVASGLSLRTIQRIEAESVASMGSRVSLAATFGIHLAQLAEERAAAPPPARFSHFASLLIGLAVLMCALIIESTRIPGTPMAPGMLAIDSLLAVLGAAVAVPAAWCLLREGKLASVAIAALGMPFAVMLFGGVIVAALRAHAPEWPLLALGSGGIALIVMARRDIARTERG